jgi:hypothetical protein
MSRELRPAREAVFASDGQLRVGENHIAPVSRMRVVDSRQCHGVAGASGAKQILGLLAELLQRWTRWKPWGWFRHEISFRWRPRPHVGLKEDRSCNDDYRQEGSALSADGMRPATHPVP